MKKFFAVLFVLLIVGAVVFYFGWAQLPVPSGSYGVIRSKTHGLDPNLVRAGEFRWVWYKLIPTNVTIQVYNLNRIDKTLSFRGRLPSGDMYAAAVGAFSGLTTDLSYRISEIISFNIKADSLISLIEEKNFTGQEDLEAYEESLASEIEIFTLGLLETLEDDKELELIIEAGLSPRLENEITEAFPQIENLSCRIPASVFPDFILYRQILEIYEGFLAKQQEYSSGGMDMEAGKQFDSRFRLDELARYGELLTKYPILLQYLTLENGGLGNLR
jgi:hypothetical protein